MGGRWLTEGQYEGGGGGQYQQSPALTTAGDKGTEAVLKLALLTL